MLVVLPRMVLVYTLPTIALPPINGGGIIMLNWLKSRKKIYRSPADVDLLQQFLIVIDGVS
jgi:hypothetical protein